MVFIASYWWLWVVITVIFTIITVLSFIATLDDNDKAPIIFLFSLPVTVSGGIISTVSIILAIIQFAKS